MVVPHTPLALYASIHFAHPVVNAASLPPAEADSEFLSTFLTIFNTNAKLKKVLPKHGIKYDFQYFIPSAMVLKSHIQNIVAISKAMRLLLMHGILPNAGLLHDLLRLLSLGRLPALPSRPLLCQTALRWTPKTLTAIWEVPEFYFI